MKRISLFFPSVLLATGSLLLTGCGNRGDGNDPAPPVNQPPQVTPAPAIPTPEVGKRYTTASGLQYEVLRVGTGARPKAWSEVLVHYHGTLPSGAVFDSSVQRGQPIDFSLDEVIPGWTEGVQLMQEGAKYRFYVPWLLAYGLDGFPPKIGPKQDLIFEIELIRVLR